MSNQPNDNPVLDQDFDLEKEIASWNFGDDFEGEDGEGNFLEGLIESEKARWAEKIWPVVRGIDFVKRPVTPAKAYVEDFLYAGCLSALIADAKAGKTTLTWAMIRAMLHGDVFLGKPTKRGKVLYISEQGEISFRHQLQRRCPEGWYEQILGNPEFYMILPEDHKLKDVLSQTVDASGW
ncbi:MAG TPA: AAA family ATPase, partial [Candidatus Acidoferrales bacterium]|nr:AAA family ATPase [Candidatus Acidoferrales bacterium]